jgi:hypothetical protein
LWYLAGAAASWFMHAIFHIDGPQASEVVGAGLVGLAIVVVAQLGNASLKVRKDEILSGAYFEVPHSHPSL